MGHKITFRLHDLILFFVLFLIAISVGYKYLVWNLSNKQSGLQNSRTTERNATQCKRDKPYFLAPEFIRAISILDQRVQQWSNEGPTNDTDMSSSWKKPFLLGSKDNFFNCLDVQYSASVQEEEGYFVFDKNSTTNDLRIFVNKKYQHADDLLTALLLVHEFAHAQQFLEFQRGEIPLNCFEKEVKAFRSQWDFLSIVNPEEFKSLKLRVNEYSGIDKFYLNLATLFNLRGKIANKCGINNNLDCIYVNLEKYLNDMIINSPYYQKQCVGSATVN